MSLIVQVFGRRHDGPIPALMRPATKKRQGTKSRWGIREGRGTLYRKMLLNGDFVFCTTCEFNNLRVAKMARLTTPA